VQVNEVPGVSSDVATLRFLEGARSFLRDKVLAGLVDPEELEKDPFGDYVFKAAAGKVGALFFPRPEPDGWLLELAAGAPGSAEDHRLYLRVARLLADRQDDRLSPLSPRK